MKPNTLRSRSVRKALVATTMAMAVAGSAFVAGPATADTPVAGGDWGFSNIGRNIDVTYNALPTNPTLVGNYPSAFGAFSIPGTTNTYGYCIELGVVSGGSVLPNQTIGGVKGAESNYIIETYGSYAKLGAPSTNSGKDDQAAAVSVALHETMDPQFNKGWTWSTGPTSMADGIDRHLSPTVRALADQYKAAAKANAGPYTISTSITKNATNSGGTVTAKILSAAGNVQPGTITLTSDNQSVFPASGNNVTTVTSGGSAAWKSVAMVPTDASLTVEAKSNSNFPVGTVITRDDGSGGQQNMLVQSGGSAPVGSANINGPLWREFTPNVTTKASAQVAKIGDELTDTLVVGVNSPNTWPTSATEKYPTLSAKSTLYGPFNDKPVEAAAAPANAPVAGTTEVAVDGPGSYVTPGVKPTAGGYYTWTETLSEGPLNPAVKSKFGVEEETTLVKWAPQITTETSTAVAESGASISDKLTVSGNQDGNKLNVSSTLYGPFAEKPVEGTTIAENAPKVGTVKTTVTGNETINTPELKVPTSGYYVWAETVEATPTTEPWVNDKVKNTETTLVKWSPQVITKTSNQIAKAGTEIFDTFTVSDNQKDQELTVTTTLYGPLLDRPVLSETKDHQNGQMQVPTNAKPVATLSTKIKGNGEFKTATVKLPTAGYYVWAETIAATDQTKPWVSDFGTKEETTVVKWSPNFSSQISDRSANVGSSVFDNVWADGLPINHGQTPLAPVFSTTENDSAASAVAGFEMKAPLNQPDAKGAYKLLASWGVSTTDTLNAKVTMYGPFTDEPKQGPKVPAGADKFSEVEVPVVNGAIVAPTFQKFTEAGWYTVVISVAGSDRVEAFTSDFGIPSETTKVSAQPTPSVQPSQPQQPAAMIPGAETGEGASMTEQVSQSGMPLAIGGVSLLLLLAGVVVRRRNKVGQL